MNLEQVREGVKKFIFGSTEGKLQEFRKNFPGLCPLCSFDRYALQHGGPAFKKTDHVCMEAR